MPPGSLNLTRYFLLVAGLLFIVRPFLAHIGLCRILPVSNIAGCGDLKDSAWTDPCSD
jgi:hypothetical protein